MATQIQQSSVRLDAPPIYLDRSRAAERAEPDRPEIQVLKDPTQLMLDMAEELGFIKAEELGGAEEAEGDEEEAFEDLIDTLIRETLKTDPTAPEQTRHDAEAARDRLIQLQVSGRSSSKALDDVLRRFTGGSSQKGLALMAELAEMAKNDPQLQRLGYGRQALEEFALGHEAGLVAALNLAGVLADSASVGQDSAQRMLGLYEESVSASQSVLQTFQRLGKSEGIDTLRDWKGFLTEAVAADLAQQSASGEKVQLQLILLELKGFRTFNTLTQGLERLGKYLPAQGAPDAGTLMQTTLDYIEQPLREFPVVEAWVSGAPSQRQILFFQGFRNLLKALPDDAYASVDQKNGLLVPPQKRVDDLTYTEDV